MLADPSIDAILFARGGYGVGRLLPRLDAEAFRAARKLCIGYSDFTAFSIWLERRCGLASIHGPMLEREGSAEARTRLLALARGERVEPLRGKSLAGGRARGRLVGGNLRMRTRTLPSSIQLELQRGDFAAALAPGILLLLLACAAALITHRLSREAKK